MFIIIGLISEAVVPWGPIITMNVGDITCRGEAMGTYYNYEC